MGGSGQRRGQEPGPVADALTVEGQLVCRCHGRSGPSLHPALRTEANQARPRPLSGPLLEASLSPEPGLAANRTHRGVNSPLLPHRCTHSPLTFGYLNRRGPGSLRLRNPPASHRRPYSDLTGTSGVGPYSTLFRWESTSGSVDACAEETPRAFCFAYLAFLFGVRTQSRKTMAAAVRKRFWPRSRAETGDTAAAKPGVWARLGE